MNNEALTTNLPEDFSSLKDVVVAQQEEIAYLKEQVKLLTHRLFGKKSEKSKAPENQPDLFDDIEEEIVEPIAEEKEVTVTYKRKKHNRKLPEDLPRETIHHDLTAEEKVCECGCELQKIGEDKYEQLEYIPAQIKVLEHIKAKYACKACEGNVKTAQAPKQPIPKSIATPGLLSQIIVNKYNHHLPLYRQEKILSQIDIDLSRATLSNWIFKCSELLRPLAGLFLEYILKSGYAQVDETTVNVLSDKERSNSYMWVAMAGPPGKKAVYFRYSPSRSQEVASNLLAGFEGFLQTDGYGGYNDLRKEEEITSLGCWSHVRRKFFEITKISKKAGAAHAAVSIIDKLYKIERYIRGANLSIDEIKNYRQEHSAPIINKFKQWLDKNISRTPPKGALGKAINYAVNQWQYLTIYIEDGRLEIDNNSVERMIKPFALGRRNWLFCGNKKGAKASAVLYSIMQTCLVNNIDPYKYFRFVLTEIPNANAGDKRDLEKFLPWNFKEQNI